jgi:hypothetical protein
LLLAYPHSVSRIGVERSRKVFERLEALALYSLKRYPDGI